MLSDNHKSRKPSHSKGARASTPKTRPLTWSEAHAPFDEVVQAMGEVASKLSCAGLALAYLNARQFGSITADPSDEEADCMAGWILRGIEGLGATIASDAALAHEHYGEGDAMARTRLMFIVRATALLVDLPDLYDVVTGHAPMRGAK